MRFRSSVSAILAFLVSLSDWEQMTSCTTPESLTNWNTELRVHLWQLMVITSCAPKIKLVELSSVSQAQQCYDERDAV